MKCILSDNESIQFNVIIAYHNFKNSTIIHISLFLRDFELRIDTDKRSEKPVLLVISGLKISSDIIAYIGLCMQTNLNYISSYAS